MKDMDGQDTTARGDSLIAAASLALAALLGAGAAVAQQDSGPKSVSCSGAEPFWSLALDGDRARLAAPSDEIAKFEKPFHRRSNCCLYPSSARRWAASTGSPRSPSSSPTAPTRPSRPA